MAKLGVLVAFAASFSAISFCLSPSWAQDLKRPVAVVLDPDIQKPSKLAKDVHKAIRAALRGEAQLTFEPPAKGQPTLIVVLKEAGDFADFRTKKPGVAVFFDAKWSDENEPTSMLAPCPPADSAACVRKVVSGALDMIKLRERKLGKQN